MSFFFHARHSFLMNYPDFLVTCITVLIVIALLSSVQSLSRVWLFATPWTTARHTSLSVTNSWSSPKPMSIESVMPSNRLALCYPLLLLPSIFPSIRVFSRVVSSHHCIGVSGSAWILPTNIQGWFPWGLTGLISLLSKGFSRVFSSTTVQKHQFFGTSRTDLRTS